MLSLPHPKIYKTLKEFGGEKGQSQLGCECFLSTILLCSSLLTQKVMRYTMILHIFGQFLGVHPPNFTKEDLLIWLRIVSLPWCETHKRLSTTDDPFRTSIFYSYMKINGHSCKVIMDSSSCVNTVSYQILQRAGLTTISHPTPYDVSWIDATTLLVRF